MAGSRGKGDRGDGGGTLVPNWRGHDREDEEMQSKQWTKVYRRGLFADEK